jgi:hypothetical protein
MEVIRKIIEVDKLRSMIEIPYNFTHSKVEILIMPFEEDPSLPPPKFNPKEFFGVSNIKNIDQKIQEIRDEWERI